MTFADLGLHPAILKALNDAGYTAPTPIQAEAVPEIIAGHDLMASAQTGTGKTAGFMLPALQKLTEEPKAAGRGPRILVLTPTRELAQQVANAAATYGKHLRRAKVVSIVGGVSYRTQNQLLDRPFEILVATPGRLIDHLQSGRIDFSRLEMLILDEADRMLDMGFSEDVLGIAERTPKTRQTALFSATLEGVVGKLADQLLTEPKRIQIAAQTARHENIEQKLHYVDDLSHKQRLLSHFIRDVDVKQAIVFTATKRDADQLADELAAEGFQTAALHGDMQQRDRQRTLLKVRRGDVRVLVATDVAARGIDVSGISHVINFDLPKFAEDYVHRIGRTGRAGASGVAISFAGKNDVLTLRRIERFTGQSITPFAVEGMEARFQPRPQGSRGDRRSGAPRSGQGRGFGGSRDGQRRGNGEGRREGFQSNREGFAGQRESAPREGFAARDGAAPREGGQSRGWSNERRAPRQNTGWRNDAQPSNRFGQGGRPRQAQPAPYFPSDYASGARYDQMFGNDAAAAAAPRKRTQGEGSNGGRRSPGSNRGRTER
nr:DEAD/DEAH box helicase [Chitinivorax tropicus]